MARRCTQKKPWANLAEKALIFALIVVAGAAALLVHVFASQWAALAVWSGIAILTLASVAYFRLRRFRYRWLFMGIFTFALGFSILLAVMQGWEAQTNIGVIGGTIIFTIVLLGALVRSTSRFNRRIVDGAHEIGEQLQAEGLFRDDGERIQIYANRGKLLGRLVLQTIGGALFGALFIWLQRISGNDLRLLLATIAAGFILGFCCISISLTIIRIAMNSPTLIVNADGIVDNGSLLVAGRGLLRWNEVLGVEDIAIDLSDIPWRQRALFKALNGSFDINLTDFRAVRQRQPLWKRALAIWAGGGRQTLGPRILPANLDRPAGELVKEVNRYIYAHAPEGGWHKSATSDEAEESDKG